MWSLNESTNTFHHPSSPSLNQAACKEQNRFTGRLKQQAVHTLRNECRWDYRHSECCTWGEIPCSESGIKKTSHHFLSLHPFLANADGTTFLGRTRCGCESRPHNRQYMNPWRFHDTLMCVLACGRLIKARTCFITPRRQPLTKRPVKNKTGLQAA